MLGFNRSASFQLDLHPGFPRLEHTRRNGRSHPQYRRVIQGHEGPARHGHVAQLCTPRRHHTIERRPEHEKSCLAACRPRLRRQRTHLRPGRPVYGLGLIERRLTDVVPGKQLAFAQHLAPGHLQLGCRRPRLCATGHHALVGCL